ncbi:hypothetical protein GR160_09105 [Flavobacterium sp. Sd200]|uniref:hypothetical protein n=1 Tax=Flavobacterium sp. Sd200 TaxID=2692211 RepID=UPI001371E847|nr:hypothetical protein [Flavobacterium sp. Sd200]MXN91386.1 hypothetical protein [Flavobacterium sp. Sd200]
MRSFSTLIAILSCIFLVNCQKDKKTEEDADEPTDSKVLVSELDTFYLGGKIVRVEKIKKSDFDEADAPVAIDTSEINNLERDSEIVKRIGDTLLFKTAAKEVTLINNNSDTDEYARYTYYGYREDMDQFVVFGGFYEWHNYILVDAQTGDQTILWGQPEVSPNGKLIVSGNSDLTAQFTDNGLQLYQSTHAPKVLGEKILQSWGPEKIKWYDNNTLYIKANVVDDNSPDLETTTHFKVILDL